MHQDQRDPWWTTSLIGTTLTWEHRTRRLQENGGGHFCREGAKSWQYLLWHIEFRFRKPFWSFFLFFDLFVMLKVAAGNQKNLWEGYLQQILWCVCKSWGIPMEDHIPLGRCAAKPLLLHLGFHRLKDTWCCWWHLLLKNNGPSRGAASFSRLKDTPYYWWLQSYTIFTDKTFRNIWSVHSEL